MNTDAFNFDRPIDSTHLNRMKWEYEIERTGRPNILCFGTADMDFASPPAIVDALTHIAQQGHYGYPRRPPAYYDAIIGYYERHFGWQIDRSWIQPNAGVYASMAGVIEELTEKGDEILYQTPVHHVFKELIELNHRVPVANPLINENGHYTMDFAQLESVITPRTKLMLLCSPHNPVGRVWTPTELRQLLDICVAHNIIILADEVYCGLLFPGQRFTPIATVSPAATTHVITFMSASKSFNLTGLKHSFTITPHPAHIATCQMAARRVSLGYGLSQFGVVATEVAFRDCDAWSTALMEYIAANYQFVATFCATHLPDVRVTRPQSTFMLWLDMRALPVPHATLHTFFEEQANILVVNGAALGIDGTGFIRLNIGAPQRIIAQGLERIVAACTTAGYRPGK
jgi:cystathionine beta-lyase